MSRGMVVLFCAHTPEAMFVVSPLAGAPSQRTGVMSQP